MFLHFVFLGYTYSISHLGPKKDKEPGYHKVQTLMQLWQQVVIQYMIITLYMYLTSLSSIIEYLPPFLPFPSTSVVARCDKQEGVAPSTRPKRMGPVRPLKMRLAIPRGVSIAKSRAIFHGC